MTGYDLVALGDVNMDHVIAENLPFPFGDLTENGRIHWQDVLEVPGGSALNLCAVAAEAGHRCLLLGRCGDDAAGTSITDWLRARGVDVPAGFRAMGQPTGTSLIMRDSRDVRLLVNSRKNSNHALSVEDVQRCVDEVRSCSVLYVSGYCVSDPSTPRHDAALHAMAMVGTAGTGQVVVFDVVPHRIHDTFTFEEFRDRTRYVDILISEVATMRRFLGLGSPEETITEETAVETSRRLTRYYPRHVLRHGPSGCDREILVDGTRVEPVHRATGHDVAPDKRGYGDRLALAALSGFFGVLPGRVLAELFPAVALPLVGVGVEHL